MAAIIMAAGEKNSINSYRDLIAWRKGIELVKFTYQETAELPDDERFGLVVQMRRSAVSIPSNIAEGWGRHTRRDYVRFLHIARGSVFELCTQAEICRELQLSGRWLDLVDKAEEVGRIINGLIRSIQQLERGLPKP